MRLEQSFEVPVPVAQAWGVFLDLERIAPCMPGATLTGFDGTAFTGTVKVKLGPISLAYRGQGRITERDETGRRLSFVAQGQDSRGAGGASARVTAVLHSAEGGGATLVKVVTDLDISGKAAQFGRGLIADVSGKVIKQFADNLEATIEATGAPAAVPAPAQPVAAPTLTQQPAVAPIPTPAPVVDAVPPPTPPPLAPVFSEPAPAAAMKPPAAPPAPPAPAFPPPPEGWRPPAAAEPEYVPPTPSNSAPPQYDPAASPKPDAEAAAAHTPPTRTEPAAPPPPGAGLRQPPVEAEPLDLLAVSGAKGALRRAAPVLIIVGVALVALIVWLVASN